MVDIEELQHDIERLRIAVMVLTKQHEESVQKMMALNADRDQLQMKLVTLADLAEDARERIHSDLCRPSRCCVECEALSKLLSNKSEL